METITPFENSVVKSRLHLEPLGYIMLDGFMSATSEDLSTVTELDSHDPITVNREIPGMPPGLFNAGVWEHIRLEKDGSEVKQTLLLGRLPQEAGAPGKGDPGPIVLSVIENGCVVSTKELWRPEADNKKGDQLEDARVVETEDGIFIGFTRLVFDEKDQKHHPFPAIAFTKTEDLLDGKFPDTFLIESFGEGDETTPLEERPEVIKRLYGKNVTPFTKSRSTPNKLKQFIFRREHHNHELTLVSLDADNNPKLEQSIDFPQDQIPWWAKDKMGTTMPPIWLNENEALFMIHGFTKVDDKPNYAVGTARLFIDDGKYYIDNISTDPLLTPQGLTDELFPGKQLQLHPEERVAMYMCGGTVDKDENNTPTHVRGLVSIGDIVTIESRTEIYSITKRWNRERPGEKTVSLAA